MGPFSLDKYRLWLAEICGYPKDWNEAVKWSIEVYNSYPEGFIQEWKQWTSPRLTCSNEIDRECGITSVRGWPNEFQTITPVPNTFKGDWWWYHPWLDGELVASEYPDISFLAGGYEGPIYGQK